MRNFDLTPLFRSSVGFDNMARVLDSLNNQQVPAYPPYNIEKLSEDAYRITMAVAGFGEGDIDIEVNQNQLVISGRTKEESEEEARTFLHRGIAERAFERRFNLAEFIKVKGASLDNGLLHVELQRVVPEEMKPRKIDIKRDSATKQIDSKAA